VSLLSQTACSVSVATGYARPMGGLVQKELKMFEIEEFESWHPRAVKLFRKKKNFIVIAEDEPYFMKAYAMIRESEIANGRWSEGDEQAYQSAQ